jgi:hypothetical protein
VRTVARAGAGIALGLGVLLASASAAAAQEDEVIGDVDISFDVGDVDPADGDWHIEVVEVSGDLEAGQDFTVELTDVDGAVLWTATAVYTEPITRIEVTEDVFVGEVASAGVEQGLTIVGGVQIEPPVVEWSAGGGAGGGQLALSMVMAVLVVAIVFRTPLPSASTQRWTK